ncbi:hypothetical protein FF125_18970 [Aureibaculum algae]|uniref:Uncharacterized protein n=1 Tax=Aureibaculum algae TaxID=2584122 RepID=A0A5B7TYI2_9FLAO|nr:hypothetical protein [Aureibaculum algae]QCX40424.1 hypothetical protein FF125_18970 [Aureibaculum algae]
MKTKTNFNGTLAFFLAIANTILFYNFLYGYGNDERVASSFFIIIPIQLGLISYFEKSNKKKLFIILTIISLIIYLILAFLEAYTIGMARAYKN